MLPQTCLRILILMTTMRWNMLIPKNVMIISQYQVFSRNATIHARCESSARIDTQSPPSPCLSPPIAAMIRELHSDTPISNYQIKEKVLLERTYNASVHSAVDGSSKGSPIICSSASLFAISTNGIAPQRRSRVPRTSAGRMGTRSWEPRKLRQRD